MQDKLARLSAMPMVRGRASLLCPRNTQRESEWPWSLEPEQEEDSVPSFPMDSSNRGHMLKRISQWQLFYRFPILKRKERETIRYQLERLGGGGVFQVLGTLLFQRPTEDFACWKGSWDFFTTVSRELQQANKYYLQIGRGGQGDRVAVQWRCRLCV